MGWLAKLTTWTTDNEGFVLDKIYPEHARALKKSKLAPAHYPTLGKLLAGNESDEEKEERRKREGKRRYTQISTDVFLCWRITDLD